MPHDRENNAWSFRNNSATGAHRIRRRLEGTISNGQRIRVDSVVLVQIGKWRGYEAQTDHGPRWGRIVGQHVEITAVKPGTAAQPAPGRE